jgi:hypothetical protein
MDVSPRTNNFEFRDESPPTNILPLSDESELIVIVSVDVLPDTVKPFNDVEPPFVNDCPDGIKIPPFAAIVCE